MIISGAESFLLKGSARGVLLIHGFTGNPAELRLLGEFLNARGLTVLCMRLAGHATQVGDLLRMTRADWLNSVLDGVSILRGLCGDISVVGHSMGGLLALQLSIVEKVERLVTMAAPIFINDAMRLNELPPREMCGTLVVNKLRRSLKDVPRGVNEAYRRMPLRSVHELVDAIEETKKILAEIRTPILIMHGMEDHTARFSSARYIYDRVSSNEKELMLFESMGHLMPLKEGREKVFESTAAFLQR